MDVKVFNESGQGYWMEGFGCLRAEGENRPSRPNHIIGFALENSSKACLSKDKTSTPIKAVSYDDYNMAVNDKTFMTITSGATDSHHIPVVCFSIGSMNSKGMLSDNPRAGIHETTIARTIDANGSNPSSYQGGDIVLLSIE